MDDNLRLSSWVQTVEGSPTVTLNTLALTLKSQGRDILNLAGGDSPFDTPAHIRAAAQRAIDEGKTHYTPAPGIPQLRDAVAATLREHAGVEYTRDQIVITTGTKYAIYLAISALIEPGDHVLIPTPYWVSYPAMVRMTGGQPQLAWAGPGQDFKVTPAELEKACTPETRGLIFNSPANPTGAVYRPSEVTAIADWATERGLWIVTDEIYAELRFTSGPCASLAGASSRRNMPTVVTGGCSKAYAMTGWRLGWLAGPAPLAKAVTRVLDQTTSCASSISQYAALAALTGPQDEVRVMASELQRRCNLALTGLRKIPRITVFEPDGGFFILMDVHTLLPSTDPEGRPLTSSEAICAYLMESVGLALVPGEGFGAPGFIRFSFAADRSVLEDALVRLADGLSRLQST